MSSSSLEHSVPSSVPTASLEPRSPKRPRLILEDVYAFPPNREILGGTSYFIVNKGGNILVDCPVWESGNQQFCTEQGGVKWLFLTHRGGISPVIQTIQQNLQCEVIIQEQESYLLPNITVNSFEQELELSSEIRLIWTSGHSPGSACLYWQSQGGILFTGRHLLPDQQGNPTPLRLSKTFHWGRQLANIEQICDRFSAQTLTYLCPGANTGFLRGKGVIDNAYERLTQLDLIALKTAPHF
ncbi:MAG: MBL fold metallo-hydrolase [Snowella sp.]|nr:MBL fold metallo-hydrolase [Snowella sp.]